MICKFCQTDITTGPVICPACAAALNDYTAKKTGVKADIRAQVIEALKWALDDLEQWHEAFGWIDINDDAVACDKCDTCQRVIPAVKAALERLEAEA